MKSLPSLAYSNASEPDYPAVGSPSFGILSTYPPTRCGVAGFGAALANGLYRNGADVSVVRVADGVSTDDSRVIGELANGSAASVSGVADLLSRSDIAVIQHDFGIYGGVDGSEVVDIVDALQVPSIVVAHTIPKDLTRHQRSVFESLLALADQVVVMSGAASTRLCVGFDVDRRKVVTIPRGAAIPTGPRMKRSGRPTLLTWGLLRPGKGVERVIDSMGSLHRLTGQPRYLVAGQTHPRTLAVDGEAYRDARIEQARSGGVAGSVHFDASYRDVPTLTALVMSAAAVVLPYDSTDQVSSAVLVEAIACGRPVVATAFPHAVELLSSGAGIVVGHDDPEALQSALHAVLSQPRLAGAMAAEARKLAPEMAWPVIARSYQAVAQRILSRRRSEPAWPR
ncbi:glycosyltransferase [Mycobacterium sp. CBMA293]|uniref:glycosyltransferase n=1 Tax=unclassified Mycolicibacterium TaxID=2636767 RepID=UPI001320EA29|nr:glycosyltransferase [Mycolicibacterium sp. CBMA 360]MUL60945.1 glycosyltransferase [Mycolicibacterium sp. CBMA 335]MUL71958.1 glycosyltransferase [Mycolicibacterium sp. CBMA 311]MUL95886.1 glycosyltransferase [Mycolicibacterium sp. CBMA 230]MUM09019.1 glycosyl transferase family 1 [Mycolicibacterium sp. CBMA 213]MUM13273.1 glycosyltransferase [Mycolicibacterium sp. CBMA 293]MUM30695.1 glycosyltransferase [Mycolicibacterium sp. CBMA 361]